MRGPAEIAQRHCNRKKKQREKSQLLGYVAGVRAERPPLSQIELGLGRSNGQVW